MLLRIIADWIKLQVENILAEENAGFWAGCNTVEQIYNSWTLCEKYRDHQWEVHHNFIDCIKKGFDRAWRKGRHFLCNEETYHQAQTIIQLVESLCAGAAHAVMVDNTVLEWFRQVLECNRDAFSHFLWPWSAREENQFFWDEMLQKDSEHHI